MLDTSTPGLPETQNELGRIFADPAAYADPKAWYESARTLREQAPIARVTLPEYQDFWAITKYSDIREISELDVSPTKPPRPPWPPGPSTRPGPRRSRQPSTRYRDGR